MYRDDLAAERARSRTLEAELEAERARRRATLKEAAAAAASRDEALLALGCPPGRPRRRRSWLIAGILLPAAALSLIVAARASETGGRLRSLGRANAELRDEVARLQATPASSRRRASRRRVTSCSLPPRGLGRTGPHPPASGATTLTRSEIQHGMRWIKREVSACYQRYGIVGLANVQVRICRDGKVCDATVKGTFAGTPTAACVEAAVGRASFPAFTGVPITITYPFVLS